MSKVLKTLKKHWTRVWLIAAVALFIGVTIAHAAYTEVASVKRVVSTQESLGDMFSSNCMRVGGSSRRLTSKDYSITVCNFDQDNSIKFNPSVVYYSLEAELMANYNGQVMTMAELQTELGANSALYQTYVTNAEKYCIYKTSDDSDGTITTIDKKYFNSGNNYKVTIYNNESLASQVSSVDRYTVEIDEADIDLEAPNFFVDVKATRVTPPTEISTRLYGAKLVTNNISWHGEFVESNCSTVDYDFYNYVITGTGTGKVDILWDPAHFEINEFFFNTQLSGNTFDNSIVVSNYVAQPVPITSSDPDYGTKDGGKYVNWKKITLSVDTRKTRYDLQLYKTSSNTPGGVSYTGNNAATQYIECVFRE